MYFETYKHSNSTDVCSDVFEAERIDRWSLTHIFLPLALVYLHNLKWQTVIMIVYIWESVEIGLITCTFNVDLEETMADILLIDPFYGAVGVLIGMLGALNITRNKQFSWKWLLLTTVAPSITLWLVNDDQIAQAVFGAVFILLFAAADFNMHQRTNLTLLMYLVITITFVTTFNEINPLYINTAISAFFALVLFRYYR